ncbi:MAG: glycoside hydrolase family 5 protein, partial [Acidobacteriaceae bacterium]|nr:glycoside hydrolase family 5 protein [Acidobacteriaceae bacterium]
MIFSIGAWAQATPPADPVNWPNVVSRPLHVQGNQLWDDLGNQVQLQGVASSGFEFSTTGEGNQSNEIAEAISDNWNSNFIRLPLNQDSWLSATNGAAYQARIDAIVSMIATLGKYVELDLHWSGCGPTGSATKQYQMPDDNSITFWQSVATHYKNNPAVLFDLFNEPFTIGWKVWRDGGQVSDSGCSTGSYHTPGLQAIVAAIRGVGATNIIIAGGLTWSQDNRGVIPGTTQAAGGTATDGSWTLEDPPPPSTQGNGIMYEVHIYPGTGGSSPQTAWDNNSTACTQNEVLCAAPYYPITVGEFGANP